MVPADLGEDTWTPPDRRESTGAPTVGVLRNRDLHVPAGPPAAHFHAQYGEYVAQIELGSLGILNGELPTRALRLVREWALLHADELDHAWELAQALEPLVAIDPLP